MKLDRSLLIFEAKGIKKVKVRITINFYINTLGSNKLLL